MYSIIMCVEMSGTKCRQNQQFTCAVTLNRPIAALLLRMAASWIKHVGDVLTVSLNWHTY
jgi:hypothetical protein